MHQVIRPIQCDKINETNAEQFASVLVLVLVRPTLVACAQSKWCANVNGLRWQSLPPALAIPYIFCVHFGK